jgi:hypothetical protein
MTMAAASRCFSFIASNEISCEASVNAKIWPVSSVGMKPFGMITKSHAVSTKVSNMTPIVKRR